MRSAPQLAPQRILQTRKLDSFPLPGCSSSRLRDVVFVNVSVSKRKMLSPQAHNAAAGVALARSPTGSKRGRKD
jgi:hypothetical protein